MVEIIPSESAGSSERRRSYRVKVQSLNSELFGEFFGREKKNEMEKVQIKRDQSYLKRKSIKGGS